MKHAISARSIGWLGFTALLLMLGLGLFFYRPPEGLIDPPSGAPSFDLQAILPVEVEDAAEIEQAARHAIEQRATTLVIDVATTDDTLFAGAGGPLLDSFIEAVDALPDTAPDDAQEIPVRYAFRASVEPDMPDREVEEFANRLIAVIQAQGIEERTIVQGFDWRLLKAVHAIMPEIARSYMTIETAGRDTVGRGADAPSPWLAGLDVNRFDASIPRTIRAAEAGEAGGPEEALALPPWQVIWAPFYRDLRAPSIAEAHSIGLKVVPWPVDEADVMRALIESGVDGLATTHPEAARAVLDALQ